MGVLKLSKWSKNSVAVVGLILFPSLVQAKEPKPPCETAIKGKAGATYRFGRTGVIASLDLSSPSTRDQGIATSLAAFLIQKKTTPTPESLAKWTEKSLGEVEGVDVDAAIASAKIFRKGELDYARLSKLFSLAHEQSPEFYAPLQAFICQQAFLFFRHRLRPPTVGELASILGIADIEFLDTVIRLPGFWEGMIESDVGRHVDYARKRISAAFARAVRGGDTPSVHRTRKVAPSTRRLVQILALTRSNEHYQWRVLHGDYRQFNLLNRSGQLDPNATEAMLQKLTEEFEAILGMRTLDRKVETEGDRWAFEMPVLFPGGMEELYRTARSDYQPTFTSFTDTARFPIEKAEAIRDLLIEKDGAVVGGFKPGREVDWAQISGMKKFAKERGFPIVLIPEDGMWQDIDPQLLEDPDLHILTHTISNDELVLSVYPSNDRSDPLAPFKKPGMYEIGQQIILPHATLAYESIPTGDNTRNQTMLFTTGTVNTSRVAAIGKNQLAKAKQISEEMKQSFLVVEKVDRGNNPTFGGTGNHWHIRPVEIKPARMFDGQEEPLVFSDQKRSYRVTANENGSFKVSTGKALVTSIVFSDLHSLFSSPSVMMGVEEYMATVIDPRTQVQVVVHDPIDDFFLNGHIQKKQKDLRVMRGMVHSGRIVGNSEINDLIGVYNAMLKRFPNIVIVNPHSNHTVWIDRHLINEPTQLQEIVNGDLREEILFALKQNPAWSPLEYLLIYRESFLKRTSMDGSDRWKQGKVFVSDPSRVRVLQPGEPLVNVSTYRGYEMRLQHHGDKGANGGKSSFVTHQKGEKRAVNGDAHRMGYSGKGENFWIGVGSMMPFEAPYTLEGYSSWGVGLATVYADGTATLVQYDPNSESFFQRAENGVLAGGSFFGNSPLQVIQPMDDDAARVEVDEDEWATWLFNKVRWLSPDSSPK